MDKFYCFVLTMMIWSTGVHSATCISNAIASTPTASFIINGDGTVMDSRTKLIWKRCPEGTSFNDNNTPANTSDDGCIGTPYEILWQQALQQVDVVNSSGFANASDWRLPNIKEFASVIELKCHHPAFNETLFPSMSGPNAYWTSSQDASDVSKVWILNTIYGSDSRAFKASFLAGALLVRNEP